MLALAAASATTAFATKPNPEHKVTICHAAPADAFGHWVSITVDVASTGYQHQGHESEHDGDIIPAYSYQAVDGSTFSYDGKNLSTDVGGGVTGAEVLANGCTLPSDNGGGGDDGDVTVAPVAPTFTGPTCDSPGAVTVPDQPEGVQVSETQDGNVVTVTFTAAEGYTLGDAQSVYTFDLTEGGSATGGCGGGDDGGSDDGGNTGGTTTPPTVKPQAPKASGGSVPYTL